jgi:hypothetical protein
LPRYDSHRESILRGGTPQTPAHYSPLPDDPAAATGDHGSFVDKIFSFFSPSAYRGFGEDEKVLPTHHFPAKFCRPPLISPQSFYNVFASIFIEIDKREMDGGANDNLPPFGGAASPWGEVSQFYAEWTEFGSRMSFAWADKYNPNEVGAIDISLVFI